MRKLKRIFLVALAAFALLPCAAVFAKSEPYGVFLGVNREDIKRVYGYDLAVIDAQGFTRRDIAKLHKKGQKVYSYLNIGSVETYRSYYKKYEKYTLDVYENWPDERWVDVSAVSWQRFVVDKLAKSLANKGVDGFFLDNADVYYRYPKKEIYSGLVAILEGLKQYGLDVIINGGDTFVKKAMKTEKDVKSLIAGVNQECVFTNINFDTGAFKKQGKQDTVYYKSYLKACKQKGLEVYLLEYSNGKKSTRNTVAKYCKANGYGFYISKSLDLDGKK